MLSARLECCTHKSVVLECLSEDVLWFVYTVLTLSVCIGDKESISYSRSHKERQWQGWPKLVPLRAKYQSLCIAFVPLLGERDIRIFYRLTRRFKIILVICTSLIHSQRSLILKKNPTQNQTTNTKNPPTSWCEFNTFAGLIHFLRSPVSTQKSKLKLDQIHSSQYNVNEFRRYVAWKFP